MSNYASKKETYQFPVNATQKVGEIITQEASAETLVKLAEEIGKALAKPSQGKGLSTSQIRAIFGEVRRIEGDWKINPQRASRNLILLKPKMEYRAKKEGSSVQRLVSVLSPAIDEVKGDEKNFTRFVDFFEAILAYHKAYGGN